MHAGVAFSFSEKLGMSSRALLARKTLCIGIFVRGEEKERGYPGPFVHFIFSPPHLLPLDI